MGLVQSIAMPGTEHIRQAVERQLKQQLSELPAPDENWINAGLDSLEVIEVLLKLETAFEQEIPVGDFADEPTTDRVVAFLVQHMQKRSGGI